jgi:crotonobetainyl-CoA:carnitine CoA-transferase CaiB-like acyl-CoA transferase
MGQPELAADPRFATLAQRAAAGDELNGLVSAWTSSMTAAEVEAACVAEDVPVARVFSSADVFTDPHMAARGDLVTVADPVLGDVRQQAPVPRFDGVAPSAPSGAPSLGQHNDEVWTELVGLSAEELAGLRDAGVV